MKNRGIVFVDDFKYHRLWDDTSVFIIYSFGRQTT